MEIEERYPIRAGEIPRIGTGSLITGDAIVEFVPGNEEQLVRLFDGKAMGQNNEPLPPNNRLDPEELRMAEQPLSNGDYLSIGEVSGDPFKVLVNLEDDMRLTLAAVRQAGQSVDALAADVRQIVGGDQTQLKDLASKSQLALEEFQLTLRDVRSLVNDPIMQESLRKSIAQFPQLIEHTDSAIRQSENTLASFERVGKNAEQAIGNIASFTQPFSTRGDEFAETLFNTMHNLDEALAQVNEFGLALNSGDGTLRRLIEDEEMYLQFKRVLANVEELTVKARPIADDIRIFSDKIARDPRQLGIKGAIDGRPSGLGIK